MQVLLFANGILNHGAMVQQRLDALDSPYILCADGGALHAQALGLTPQTIIGDLDSLSEDQVNRFIAAGTEVIRHPRDKNETDLELALHHCRQIGATSITLLAALGGRFDQTIANIFLLSLPPLRDMSIEVLDGAQSIRLLQPGQHSISGKRGDTISLIPLASAAGGISTQGLQYPLHGETLPMGPARGLSNVMLANQAQLEFESGLLLLVHTIGRA